MKKIITIILVFANVVFSFMSLSAQSISHKVISSAGGTLTGGSNQITFNIGETVIPTLSAGGNQLTQGFDQPSEQLSPEAVATSVCQGNSISVPYTAIDIGAGNTFTAQLSDASGSFAAPVNIGTDSGNASGSISATNPMLTPPGSGYRIRVVSSFSAVIANDNGSNVIVCIPAFALSGTVTHVACRGSNTGSISLSPSGGVPPYTYLWNNGSTNQNRTALVAGTYTVTVTSSNLSTISATFTVTQPATNLVINTIKVNVKCNGGLTGVATAAPVGGAGPYNYSWNTIPVKTTASISGLAAGAYTCSVTDAGGCTKTVIITITQPTPFVSTQSQTNVTFSGGNDVTASVTVSGSTPGYTYSWNTVPIKTTASVNGLTAGIYKCTVRDSKSCQLKLTFTITEPTPKTNIDRDEQATLLVSPNPTIGKFKVSMNQTERRNYYYVIEDFSGKVILKQCGSMEAGQHEISMDLSGMSKGIYFMKWVDDNLTAVKRIVLQ